MNEEIKLWSRDEKYLIIIVTLNDSLVFIRVRVMMTLMPTVPATNVTIFEILEIWVSILGFDELILRFPYKNIMNE